MKYLASCVETPTMSHECRNAPQLIATDDAQAPAVGRSLSASAASKTSRAHRSVADPAALNFSRKGGIGQPRDSSPADALSARLTTSATSNGIATAETA